MKFQIESVNISEKKGTAKTPVPQIRLIAGIGIEGDAHAGPGLRQVSLLAGEAIDAMKSKLSSIQAGAFGENLITRGVDWTKSSPGERITIGEVELEITQIGKECHTPCAIYRQVGECIMPLQGIFARVLKGGIIHGHDCGHYYIRPGVEW